MSRIIPLFWGVVTDGKLTVHNRPEFDKYLMTLKGEV